MAFLTEDKLVIVGAGGAIGSTMVQTALTMKLTPNVCLYDVYAPGMEGVMEEMFHCGYDGVNLTATTDVAEAFKDAKYIISSGGAPRKAGMTREDLLAGNCKIAEELGKNIKAYCPDVKHVVVIFNPADLTGLVTLLYSGLKPSQVTTLAALDSTRLQSALAKKFGVKQYEVTGCATYGGAKIIELRGRSSWQSPAYCSVEMIRSVMGGEKFRWPAGTYVKNEKYQNIMMAMDTTLDENGCTYKMPQGNAEEMAKLDASYAHLCKMRDELVTLNIVPPVAEWTNINPNL